MWISVSDTLFALIFLIDFFEAVGSTASFLGKLSRKEDISEKYFLYPTSTYSRLCSSEHTCMKILITAGFLTLGVIYSVKNVGVHKSPPKTMQIISASRSSFERRYAHIQT